MVHFGQVEQGEHLFSACVSNILWFVSVTIEVLSSELCVVCICALGVCSIYKHTIVYSLNAIFFCSLFLFIYFFFLHPLGCSHASQGWWGSGGGERCWVSPWHWGKNPVTPGRRVHELQRTEVHS